MFYKKKTNWISTRALHSGAPGFKSLFGARLYLFRMFVLSSVCLGKLFYSTALDAFMSFLVYFH